MNKLQITVSDATKEIKNIFYTCKTEEIDVVVQRCSIYKIGVLRNLGACARA